MAEHPYASFRAHFEANRGRPLPAIANAAIDNDALGVRPEQRAPIAFSLARFQLGEAGEGRIATEIDRVHRASVDDDYRAALKLFVAEEGRHARILGAILRACGGALLSSSWTERLFVHGRRLLGLRTKLLALLAAEVVGITFYRAIAARLSDGLARRALFDIIKDEEAHLRFHVAFLARDTASPLYALWVACAWTIVGCAAGLVVTLDHARALRALGASPTALFRRFVARVVVVRRKIARAQSVHSPKSSIAVQMPTSASSA